MQDNVKYRKYLVASFITFIIAVLALSVLYWNFVIKSGYTPSKIIFSVLLIVLLFLAIVMFLIGSRLSNNSRLTKFINDIKKEERNKTIDELKSNEVSEEVTTSNELQIQESLKSLLPEMRNIKSIEKLGEKILQLLSAEFEIVQGLFYLKQKNSIFKTIAKFAFTREEFPEDFKQGETLPGEAAKSKEIIVINNIPENYFKIESGLGNSHPCTIVFIPLISRKRTIAVIEIALFKEISDLQKLIFEKYSGKLAERITKFIKE